MYGERKGGERGKKRKGGGEDTVWVQTVFAVFCFISFYESIQTRQQELMIQ